MNKEKLHGLSPTLVAREAGISRASVYNWINGGGPYVAYIIEPVIKNLLKQQSNDQDHGLRQESELERSVSN